MSKKDLKSLIKMVEKKNEYELAFCDLTLEDVDYLYTNNISVEIFNYNQKGLISDSTYLVTSAKLTKLF